MNDEQFKAIWQAAYPGLFSYCQFRCASLADAEDLTAEVFARLLAHRAMPDTQVLPWLYRVAMTLHADRMRAASREVLVADPGSLAGSTEQWFDPTLWDAVRRLVPKQQLVIYLRIVEGRSFREIAATLGRTEAAAKMLHRRALDRLGALLEVTDDERGLGTDRAREDSERLRTSAGGGLRDAGAREARE